MGRRRQARPSPAAKPGPSVEIHLAESGLEKENGFRGQKRLLGKKLLKGKTSNKPKPQALEWGQDRLFDGGNHRPLRKFVLVSPHNQGKSAGAVLRLAEFLKEGEMPSACAPSPKAD